MVTTRNRAGVKRNYSVRYRDYLESEAAWEEHVDLNAIAVEEESKSDEVEEDEAPLAQRPRKQRVATKKNKRKKKATSTSTSPTANEKANNDNKDSTSMEVEDEEDQVAKPKPKFDKVPDDTIGLIFENLTYRDCMFSMPLVCKSWYNICRKKDHLWIMFKRRMWPDEENLLQVDAKWSAYHAFRHIFKNGCIECGGELRSRSQKFLTGGQDGYSVYMCGNCHIPGSTTVGRSDAVRVYGLTEQQTLRIPYCAKYVRKWRSEINMMPEKLVLELANEVHFNIGGFNGLERAREVRKRARQEASIRRREERQRKLDLELQKHEVQCDNTERMYQDFVDGRTKTTSAKKWVQEIISHQQREERRQRLQIAMQENEFTMHMDYDLRNEFIASGDLSELDSLLQILAMRNERRQQLRKGLRTHGLSHLRQSNIARAFEDVSDGYEDMTFDELVEKLLEMDAPRRAHVERQRQIIKELKSRDLSHFGNNERVRAFVADRGDMTLEQIMEELLEIDAPRRASVERQRQIDVIWKDDQYREYKDAGLTYCEEFVQYGEPTFEEVVNRLKQYNQRRAPLMKALMERSIPAIPELFTSVKYRDYLIKNRYSIDILVDDAKEMVARKKQLLAHLAQAPDSDKMPDLKSVDTDDIMTSIVGVYPTKFIVKRESAVEDVIGVNDYGEIPAGVDLNGHDFEERVATRLTDFSNRPSSRKLAFDPCSSYKRLCIHQAVQRAGLRSSSKGKGNRRHVTVFFPP